MRVATFSAAAVTLLLAATLASAHICLTYPMQRGPTPRLFPGDPACFNRVANCSSLPQGAPTAKYVAGTLETVTFQQNLNHWNESHPGHFDLAVSYDNATTWVALGNPVSDFPANNMNTQTDFSVPVVFPRAAVSAILRARYVSNNNQTETNPANNTGAIYYSCADVAITNKNGTFAETAHAEHRGMAAQALHLLSAKKVQAQRAAAAAAAAAEGDFNCVAPSAFIAEGETRVKGALQPVLHHTIHYDAAAGWVKWNRNDTKLGGSFDVTDLWNLTMANNGSYTPHCIVGLNGHNTSSMYRGSAFYPWSFGPKNGMVHRGNETRRDGSVIANWAIDSADFEFTSILESATATTCVPHVIRHGVLQTELFAKPVASIDPSVFAVPANCTANTTMPDGGSTGPRRN